MLLFKPQILLCLVSSILLDNTTLLDEARVSIRVALRWEASHVTTAWTDFTLGQREALLQRIVSLLSVNKSPPRYTLQSSTLVAGLVLRFF